MAHTRYPSPFYGEILRNSYGSILFGKAGFPLHADQQEFTEDVLRLYWEWTWAGEDGLIDAVLNGRDVCMGHSKTHIIDYSYGEIGGEFNYGSEGIVEADVTGSWIPYPYLGYYDPPRSPPSSVSIRCWCDLFGQRKEITGTDVLKAHVWINLMNNQWTLTAG